MEFKKDEVYASTLTHTAIPNFAGDKSAILEEFYKGIQSSFSTLALDNMQISNISMNIGGGFFGGNNVSALGLSYKQGKLKKLSAFFLITNVGNVFTFSLYQQVSMGLFDAIVGINDPAHKIALVESKLKSIEEMEEFSIFNSIANLIYGDGIKATSI